MSTRAIGDAAFTLSGVRPPTTATTASRPPCSSTAAPARLSRSICSATRPGRKRRHLAHQTLDTAHHGIAEPLGGLVLASHATASGDAPDSVSVPSCTATTSITRRRPACRLHSGASNATHSVFGCDDGALVAELHGDHFDDAKIAVAERLATVGPDGGVRRVLLPRRQSLCAGPEAGTAARVDWRRCRGWRRRPGQPAGTAFDAHGEHLLIRQQRRPACWKAATGAIAAVSRCSTACPPAARRRLWR